MALKPHSVMQVVGIAVFLFCLVWNASAQCSKDTDCKGNRICVQGKCVNAPAAVHHCGKDAECSGDSICKNGQCAPPDAAAPAPVQAQATQVSQPASEKREAPKGLMSRGTGIGITSAVWLPGTVNYDKISDQYDPQKVAGFLLRVFIDGYVAEKFAVGAYVAFSPMSWDGYSSGSTMFEVGFSLKPRFSIGNGAAAIKPGFSIGYRSMSSDRSRADGVKGMAADMSCELQFDTHNIFVPYIEIGFLAQPTGGNDYDDINYPPIFYIGGGIAF